MADQGTEAMEREKAALFATKEGRYFYRLQEALRRLYRDPDNFGRCHATGKPISFERLDALPARPLLHRVQAGTGGEGGLSAGGAERPVDKTRPPAERPGPYRERFHQLPAQNLHLPPAHVPHGFQFGQGCVVPRPPPRATAGWP